LTRFVLDVSTAAKWVIPGDEPLREEANGLLKQHRRAEIDFIVPDLFWAELGNVLWKTVRTGRQSRPHAEQALREMRTLDFVTIPTQEVSDDALSIACATERSFYDSVYVALAVQSGVSMVTADERLANALGTRWPVRWLGTF
jgi:predicted nucleic acid-binding protein